MTSRIMQNENNIPLKDDADEEEFYGVDDDSIAAASPSSSYNFALTLSSWEQIGSLTSEIASSVMARQASILSELSRPPSSKRRRLNTDSREGGTITRKSSRVVTSDEESSTGSTTTNDDEEQEAFARSSSIKNGDDDDDDKEEEKEQSLTTENIFRQVDRLGRMSKLMIEMEYCHRQMQAEMQAMAEDNDLLEI